MGDLDKTEKVSDFEYVPSICNLHRFAEEIAERKIIFNVIKMNESILIYVNDKDNFSFNDLSLAMINRYDNSAMGTKLLGGSTEDSKNMSAKLSKKLNKAVFLSFNIDQERLLNPLIEKRLNQEIKNYPGKF